MNGHFRFCQYILIVAFTMLMQSLHQTAFGQFAVAANSDPIQLAQGLTGKGVSLSNITLNCHQEASGFFTGGLPTVTGMNNGVVLATGRMNSMIQPAASFMGDLLFTPGDPDLNNIIGGPNGFDACVLEFDIRPLGDTIQFNFVFASEEYPEYVCSNFNDVFAFFLTGNRPGGGTYNKANIALIPGTNLPVAINTVNPGVAGSAASGGNCNGPGESKSYSAFYRTNNASNLVFDGMTIPITAKAAVIPCETYRLKFAIQDVFDGSYDSGVFLTSIRSNAVSVSTYTNSPVTQNVRDVYEDSVCNRAWYRFELDTVYPYSTTVKYDVLGTATNGVDYVAIIDSVVIPAGQSFVDLPIIPITDSISEGVERVALYLKGSCSSDYVDSAFIYIYDQVIANAGPDTNLCPGQTLQLNGEASTDFPWQQLFSFSWFPAQYVSNPSIATPDFVRNPNKDTVLLFLRTQLHTCVSDTDTVVIAYTRKPKFSIDAGSNQSICLGDSVVLNLSVVDSVADAPFSFSWTPAATLSDAAAQNPTAKPISNTRYIVEVSSRFGCALSDSVDVNVVTPPAFSLTRSLDTICEGFPVQLNFVLSGGLYDSIVWSPTSGVNAVDNKNAVSTTAAPITSQLYRLSAHRLSCVTTDSILIVVDDALTVNAGNDTLICLGNSAQLNATVAGNKGAVVYAWQPAGSLNSSTVANPTATPASNTVYKVTASSVGCVKSDSVLVSVYSIATTLSKTDVNCFGGSDGSLTASPTGGVAPYGFQWSNNAPDNAVQNGVQAATYSVTASDANGCSATAAVQVSQPDALSFSNVLVENVRCFGGTDGGIQLQVAGGTQAYNYTWQPQNVNAPFVNSASAGSYALTVVDANGCLKDTTFVVSEPTELAVDTLSGNVSCFGGNNGFAQATASGGTPAYSFAWSNGDTTSGIQSIESGTYSVTVNDNNQCSKSATFTISQPTPFTCVALEVKAVSCFGGNDGEAVVQVTNGNAPFSYLWSNGALSDTAKNLAATGYQVTVTDGANCTATANVLINQPTALNATPSTVDAKCFGGNDGSIQSNASGGTPPYTYNWSNNSNTQNISGLNIGTYTATVTDNNGCSITLSQTLTQPDSLSVFSVGLREQCIGSANGKIVVFANGGIFPYSIAYSSDGFSFNASSADTIKNLAAGNYVVRLTDANSCTVTRNVTVGSPPKDEYDYIVEMPSCYGFQYDDGSIAVRGLESQNSPFKFSINDEADYNLSGFFPKLGVGFYTINIENKNGCDTTLIVEVPSPYPADLQIIPSDTTLRTGEKIELDVRIQPFSKADIKSYFWEPQQGLSCVDCPNPVFSSYDDVTDVYLTVIYNKGCVAKAKARFETDSSPEVFVPNMFSPNGDGVNDKFFVYGIGVRDFDLKIFNRWGEKVFATTTQSEGWDGFFRNEIQEPGTYVYLLNITYLNNRTFSKTGSVTLVR